MKRFPRLLDLSVDHLGVSAVVYQARECFQGDRPEVQHVIVHDWFQELQQLLEALTHFLAIAHAEMWEQLPKLCKQSLKLLDLDR